MSKQLIINNNDAVRVNAISKDQHGFTQLQVFDDQGLVASVISVPTAWWGYDAYGYEGTVKTGGNTYKKQWSI